MLVTSTTYQQTAIELVAAKVNYAFCNDKTLEYKISWSKDISNIFCKIVVLP